MSQRLALGRVAVAGHVCLDLSPRFDGPAILEPGRLVGVGPARTTVGGSVANTGSVLAALGAKVDAWAAIGDDDLGEIVRRRLAATPGVHFHPVVVGAATSYSIVVEPPGVDRAFWHHPGANAEFDPSTVDLDGVGLLHFGYPSLMPGLATSLLC